MVSRRPFTSGRLSPDGRRIAVHVEAATSDVWVYDLTRGTFSRVTNGPEFEGNPVWSADGARIVFASDRGPALQLFQKPWDDSRQEEAMAPGEFARVPHSWSPDGRFLAFTENHPETGRDIWIVPAARDAQPYRFLVSSSDDNQPVFSPDGKWLAYHSDESGTRDEVYVRPVAGAGGRIQISTAGGSTPRWSANGELFYRQSDRKMIAVRFKAGSDPLEVVTTTPLFEGNYLASYDVASDGQRFLMIRAEPSEYPGHLVLVQHGLAGFRR